MIVSCPECKTQYRVDASAFRGRGRSVRCGRCGCEWRQAAPDPAPEAALADVDDLLASRPPARHNAAAALPRSARAALPSAVDLPDYEPEPVPERATRPEPAPEAVPRWRPERAWSAEEIFEARAAAAAFPGEPEPEPEFAPQRRPEPAKRRPDADALAAARDFEAWFGTGDEAEEPALASNAPLRAGRSLERVQSAARVHDDDDDAPAAERALGAARRAPHSVSDDVAEREPSNARRALDNLRRRRAERRLASGGDERGLDAAPSADRRRHDAHDDRSELRAERPSHDGRDSGARRMAYRDRGRAEPREPAFDTAFDTALADGVFVDDAERGGARAGGVFDRARHAGLAAARAARMRSETARRALASTSLGRKIAIAIAALALAGAASYAVSPRGGGQDLLASITPRVDALLTPTSVSGVRPGVVFVDSKYDVVTRDEGKALEVWGVVANNGPEIALTPTIEIVSRGENGEALQRWLAIPEKDQLSPGETSRFTARMMNPEGPVFDVDLYIANHR